MQIRDWASIFALAKDDFCDSGNSGSSVIEITSVGLMMNLAKS